MTCLQLPVGIPHIAKDGKILNSCARIGRKIGSGRHGTAYDGILNGEKVCFKKHLTGWSNAFISNPAKHEYGRLVQARADLAGIENSLQAPIGWYKDPLVGAVLVTSLIRDYNGAPSRSLEETAVITPSFLQELEGIFEYVADTGSFYNPTPANILVQRISPTESHPVLIDFTNYENYLHYPVKGVACLLSAGNKVRHVAKWLHATITVARGKVDAGNTISFNELRLPSR